MKNNRCYYCEREFNVAYYGSNKALAKTKDHIIPRSRGGKNKSPNLVDCCAECNGFKGALLPEWHLNKALTYARQEKRYKTLSPSLLKTVASNIERLLNTIVNLEGANLYIKSYEPPKKEKKNKWIMVKIPIPPTPQPWTKQQFDNFFEGKEHFHYYAP